MASILDLAQDVLTHGIDAYAETQQARYQANDPTPNNRGNSSRTSPAGQPAFDTLKDTLTNPTNLVLLGVAAILVFVLVKRLR
jgi:hypothetical protein